MACSKEFNEAFRNYGSQIAVVAGSKHISYDQFHFRIENTVRRLKQAGFKPGDRVAIISPNSLACVILLQALWRIEAVACLLDLRESDEVIQRQFKELNCRYKVISPDHLNIQNLSHDSTQTSDREATIMFTSGSSSSPKAVVHTLGNHYFNAKGSNENIPVSGGDRWLLSLPLYHVSGLSILFRALLGGGAIVIPQPQENLAESIKKYSVTHVSFVPTQLFRLLRDDSNIGILKNLKAILLGGSATPDALIQKAKEYQLPLYTTYGLTEMASQVATSKIQKNKTKVLRYREIKISQEKEILVRGETLFQGYWKNGQLNTPFTDDGWFKTGDLGYLNKSGDLTVTGRKDNMFVSGGENIYPEEIEQQLLSMKKIEQAVVVPVKDAEFGFRPITFIKIRDNKNIPAEEIIAYLKEKLASFKIPVLFYPWPKDQESGIKINRRYFSGLIPQ